MICVQVHFVFVLCDCTYHLFRGSITGMQEMRIVQARVWELACKIKISSFFQELFRRIHFTDRTYFPEVLAKLFLGYRIVSVGIDQSRLPQVETFWESACAVERIHCGDGVALQPVHNEYL